MTTKQFTMAMKILETNYKVSLSDFTLELKPRIATIYELDLFIEGKKTVLFVGPSNECLQSAREYISMRYNIN